MKKVIILTVIATWLVVLASCEEKSLPVVSQEPNPTIEVPQIPEWALSYEGPYVSRPEIWLTSHPWIVKEIRVVIKRGAKGEVISNVNEYYLKGDKNLSFITLDNSDYMPISEVKISLKYLQVRCEHNTDR